ncbi:MAG: HNH endonuclease [Chloroflexi bacterium]|nr:MAG: HNH endonuclease [Chloroflexota bacterium]
MGVTKRVVYSHNFPRPKRKNWASDEIRELVSGKAVYAQVGQYEFVRIPKRLIADAMRICTVIAKPKGLEGDGVTTVTLDDCVQLPLLGVIVISRQLPVKKCKWCGCKYEATKKHFRKRNGGLDDVCKYCRRADDLVRNESFDRRLKMRAAKANQSARKYGAVGHLEASDLYAKIAEQTDENGNLLCAYSKQVLDLEGDWHIDHIKPLSKGGENTSANIVICHPKANLSKGARGVGWLAERGIDHDRLPPDMPVQKRLI